MSLQNAVRGPQPSAVIPVNDVPEYMRENPFDRIVEVAVQAIAPLNENGRFFDFDPARIAAPPDPFRDFA